MGKILLLCFLFYGCGRNNLLDVINKKGTPKRKTIDIAFEKYSNKYNEITSIPFVVPIVFGDTGKMKAGVCKKWSNGYREININKYYWDKMSEGQREQVIFHELEHCVFDKGHDDDVVFLAGINCPMSVMRSYAFNEYEINNCYNYDYQHYINELGVL